MSIKVIADVMQDPRYDGKQKLILIAIANAVNHDGVGFASHQQIQRVTDVSATYIRQCISGFVQDGRLEIVSKGIGRGNATVYRVLPRADAEGDKRETGASAKGKPDLAFSGAADEAKRETPAHGKGKLRDDKRETPAPLKGKLRPPKRETPPSSPPSFTSLDTSSLETSSGDVATEPDLGPPSAPVDYLGYAPPLGAALLDHEQSAPAVVLELRPKGSSPSAAITNHNFEEFWQAYPRKVGKGKAREAYGRALRSTDAATLAEQARRYAHSVRAKDPQYIPYPTTWLNQERWADDLPEARHVPEGWLLRPDGIMVDGAGRLWDKDGCAL